MQEGIVLDSTIEELEPRYAGRTLADPVQDAEPKTSQAWMPSQGSGRRTIARAILQRILSYA